MKLLKNTYKISWKFLGIILILSAIEFLPQNRKIQIGAVYSNNAIQVQPDNKKVAIVGDLQRTSIWEMVMGRESNDEERNLLINEINRENPSMLVLLGDMVFDGSDEAQWRDFDKLVQPVRNSSIPIFPVLGNHEYWGLNSAAEKCFCKRFPQFIKQHWYTQVHDSLAMVFLDSNEPDLSKSEWKQQQAWYEKKMVEFDSDPSVKGVLVFDHHPPYTNSIVTGDELDVQLAFVPAFSKSKKGLAIISGHAHTYERFLKDGKTYIVSGGGGGPRVGLKKGIDFHKDLYTGSSPRPFHFLLVERDDTGVKVTVRGLLKGTTTFFTVEEFYLPLQNYKIAKLQD